MIGQTLGKFRIVREIGSGGFGSVYLAEHVEVANLTRAIKVARDPEYIRYLQREAHVLAQLAHSRIVRIDNVVSDHDPPYIVMEYAEQGDLRCLLERGPLAVERAVQVTLDALEALQHAHANNIIHRDIKPSNILLDREGRAKVSDFGLGRTVGQESFSATQENLKHSTFAVQGARVGGDMAGTLKYMSPEQRDPDLLKGKPLDHRSDLYSLGAVFYEMLTGDSPAGASDPPSRVWSRVPQSLNAIVRRMLAGRPEARYQSANAAAQDIDAFLRERRPPRIRRPPRAWERWLGAALGLLLLALAGRAVLESERGRSVSRLPDQRAPLVGRRAGPRMLHQTASRGPQPKTPPAWVAPAQPPRSPGSAEHSGRQPGSASPATLTTILDERIPTTAGGWQYQTGTFSVGGIIFDERGVIDGGAFGHVIFDVRGYDWFAARMGIADSVSPSLSGASVTVTAYTNGEQVDQWVVRNSERAVNVVVPLTGKDALELRGGHWVSVIEPRLGRGPMAQGARRETRQGIVRPRSTIVDETVHTTAGGWQYDNSRFSVKGEVFVGRGMVDGGAFGHVVFDVKGYDWFAARLGIVDNVSPSLSGASVTVTAYTNGEQVDQWVIRNGERAFDVVVPLTGKDTLGLRGGHWVGFIEPRLGTGRVPRSPPAGH